jgi:hypothetical protein
VKWHKKIRRKKKKIPRGFLSGAKIHEYGAENAHKEKSSLIVKAFVGCCQYGFLWLRQKGEKYSLMPISVARSSKREREKIAKERKNSERDLHANHP